ncbi:hypothetical protein BDK51DRAFT_29061 [Blyttiomyces helicus]|uniref:Uncharacterized protein n=1 Tax=Blyttiomyces helicus TaxID=388810 RepID=A0A4P9WM42_9FUNG|nr:hypothetical protein BDK51DRAFT_29061 [Blyttiomyces helicus]|eukprot:RKO94131.1 hypothetical protein BDK51DRAFT_29061 [Blyttiomyces helicus]
MLVTREEAREDLHLRPRRGRARAGGSDDGAYLAEEGCGPLDSFGREGGTAVKGPQADGRWIDSRAVRGRLPRLSDLSSPFSRPLSLFPAPPRRFSRVPMPSIGLSGFTFGPRSAQSESMTTVTPIRRDGGIFLVFSAFILENDRSPATLDQTAAPPPPAGSTRVIHGQGQLSAALFTSCPEHLAAPDFTKYAFPRSPIGTAGCRMYPTLTGLTVLSTLCDHAPSPSQMRGVNDNERAKRTEGDSQERKGDVLDAQGMTLENPDPDPNTRESQSIYTSATTQIFPIGLLPSTLSNYLNRLVTMYLPADAQGDESTQESFGSQIEVPAGQDSLDGTTNEELHRLSQVRPDEVDTSDEESCSSTQNRAITKGPLSGMMKGGGKPRPDRHQKSGGRSQAGNSKSAKSIDIKKPRPIIASGNMDDDDFEYPDDDLEGKAGTGASSEDGVTPRMSLKRVGRGLRRKADAAMRTLAPHTKEDRSRRVLLWGYLQSFAAALLIGLFSNLIIYLLSLLPWRSTDKRESISPTTFVIVATLAFNTALQGFTNAQFIARQGFQAWRSTKMPYLLVLSDVIFIGIMSLLAVNVQPFIHDDGDWPFWYYGIDVVIIVVQFAIGSFYAGYYGYYGMGARTTQQKINDGLFLCMQELLVAGLALIYGYVLMPIYAWLSYPYQLLWRLTVHPIFWEFGVKFAAKQYLVSQGDPTVINTLLMAHAQIHAVIMQETMIVGLNSLIEVLWTVSIIQLGRVLWRSTTMHRNSETEIVLSYWMSVPEEQRIQKINIIRRLAAIEIQASAVYALHFCFVQEEKGIVQMLNLSVTDRDFYGKRGNDLRNQLGRDRLPFSAAFYTCMEADLGGPIPIFSVHGVLNLHDGNPVLGTRWASKVLARASKMCLGLYLGNFAAPFSNLKTQNWIGTAPKAVGVPRKSKMDLAAHMAEIGRPESEQAFLGALPATWKPPSRFPAYLRSGSLVPRGRSTTLIPPLHNKRKLSRLLLVFGARLMEIQPDAINAQLTYLRGPLDVIPNPARRYSAASKPTYTQYDYEGDETVLGLPSDQDRLGIGNREELPRLSEEFQLENEVESSDENNSPSSPCFSSQSRAITQGPLSGMMKGGGKRRLERPQSDEGRSREGTIKSATSNEISPAKPIIASDEMDDEELEYPTDNVKDEADVEGARPLTLKKKFQDSLRRKADAVMRAIAPHTKEDRSRRVLLYGYFQSLAVALLVGLISNLIIYLLSLLPWRSSDDRESISPTTFIIVSTTAFNTALQGFTNAQMPYLLVLSDVILIGVMSLLAVNDTMPPLQPPRLAILLMLIRGSVTYYGIDVVVIMVLIGLGNFYAGYYGYYGMGARTPQQQINDGLFLCMQELLVAGLALIYGLAVHPIFWGESAEGMERRRGKVAAPTRRSRLPA